MRHTSPCAPFILRMAAVVDTEMLQQLECTARLNAEGCCYTFVYRNTSDTSHKHQEAKQSADCAGEWGSSAGLPYSGWCYRHAPLSRA